MATMRMERSAVTGTREGKAVRGELTHGLLFKWNPDQVEKGRRGGMPAWLKGRGRSAGDFCCNPRRATFCLGPHGLWRHVSTLSLGYPELWIVVDSLFSPLVFQNMATPQFIYPVYGCSILVAPSATENCESHSFSGLVVARGQHMLID